MMKGMSDMKGMLGKMGGGDPTKALGGKMGKHTMNKAMSMMRKFK
jgi:RecA/RadA recombinase